MDRETVEVSEDRVRKAVRELKNGESCGPEGVYAEMLKHGTDKMIKMLTWIRNKCLNGEETPQQWKVAYVSSIHKKGSKKDCSNNRGISVTSVMSRLYGKILRDLREEENEVEQSGFRTERSCTVNIFCMKQVIEKRIATNQETHLLFVDLTKAYDSITISKLWEVLGESNINNTLIKALQNLYGNTNSNSVALVRTRTIPTERPPPVGEVSANFCG